MYQLSLLGTPTAAQREILLGTIGEMIFPFGLMLKRHLNLLDAGAVVDRDIKDAFVAAYFAGSRLDPPNEAALDYVVGRNLPVIPVVDDLRKFQQVVPPALRGANGI